MLDLRLSKLVSIWYRLHCPLLLCLSPRAYMLIMPFFFLPYPCQSLRSRHFPTSKQRRGLNFWRLLVRQWIHIFDISNKYCLIYFTSWCAYIMHEMRLILSIAIYQGYELLHQMEPYINQVTLEPIPFVL